MSRNVDRLPRDQQICYATIFLTIKILSEVLGNSNNHVLTDMCPRQQTNKERLGWVLISNMTSLAREAKDSLAVQADWVRFPCSQSRQSSELRAPSWVSE